MVVFAWDGGQVEADVIIERGSKYSLDVSENAVETGYTIANSTLRKPIEITIKQAVSPTNEGYGASGQEMNGFFFQMGKFLERGTAVPQGLFYHNSRLSI